LNFNQFLSSHEREYLKKLREFLKKEIENQINDYILRKEFPLELVKKLVMEFPGILGFTSKGYGSVEMSNWLCWSVLIEVAKCDLSLATFVLINGGELVMKTIHQLGNEEQRQKYLPKMNNLDIIGSFCLTEPDYGSDASSLKTTAVEEGDNVVINGKKTWIGNGSIAKLLIVWARNSKNNEIEGYIVDAPTEGLKVDIIEGKLSTLGVINCSLEFKNVKIPKKNKLEKATSFREGATKMLFGSRLGVAYLSCGACIGAYDRVINYCSNRKQFGKFITSFQIIQEKIAKIMGNTQSMLFLCKRMSDLYIDGSLTIGQVGLCKAWCTSRARETLAIAREILGGNGILIENWIMKTMIDLESLHTYEGTADINMLVAAKELTGIQAFI
jgi:alkylation response protein AidB-like acyl-CoA dehydrogenase